MGVENLVVGRGVQPADAEGVGAYLLADAQVARILAGAGVAHWRLVIAGQRDAAHADVARHVALADFISLFVGVLHVDANQVAQVFRAGFVADGAGVLGVDFLHVLGGLYVGFQEDVGVVMLGAPDQRLRAAGAGNPDRRVRLLHRNLEGVDHAEVVVLALPAPGAGFGPGLHHQVVGFLEPLAVEKRVGVGRQALDAGSPHKSRHQPPAGNHVYLGQLFGQANRVVEDGQGVAQQDNLGLLGGAGQNGRLQVHGGAQAGGGVVMLVEHQAVKAHFLRVFVLVEVHIVELGAALRVEVAVGEGQAHGVVGAVAHVLLGVVHVGALGKPHQEHGLPPCL